MNKNNVGDRNGEILGNLYGTHIKDTLIEIRTGVEKSSSKIVKNGLFLFASVRRREQEQEHKKRKNFLPF